MEKIGKVNHHEISRSWLFHLFGDDYSYFHRKHVSKFAVRLAHHRAATTEATASWPWGKPRRLHRGFQQNYEGIVKSHWNHEPSSSITDYPRSSNIISKNVQQLQTSTTLSKKNTFISTEDPREISGEADGHWRSHSQIGAGTRVKWGRGLGRTCLTVLGVPLPLPALQHYLFYGGPILWVFFGGKL